MLKSYGDQGFRMFQFDKSAKISTYLYCVIAGPYECFVPNEEMTDAKIPMKLYGRQSLKHFIADAA